MCLDFLCCCVGPRACGLCCGAGKIKNSLTTRLLYLLFLIFVIVVSPIFLSSSVSNALERAYLLCVPFDVRNNSEFTLPSYAFFVPTIRVNSILNCGQFVGYLAVYRICMAVASFFFLLFLLMICVWSSKDPRSYIQNGFWCIKWLLVIGLIVAFFFIPDGGNLIFSRTSLSLGLAAAVIFIVVQVILLVDFAHSWAENWIERAEENDNKWWYILMLTVSIVLYVMSLVGIILMYVFFIELRSCSLNKFFISSTLIISVAVSVVAVLPWVQKVQPKSGLLQASVITAYCTYVTWSAVTAEPYGAVPGTNNTEFYDCRLNYGSFSVFGQNTPSSLAATIVGILVLLLTVVYMCFRLSGSEQLRKLRGSKKEENTGSALCCDCFPDQPDDADVDAEEGSDSDKKVQLHHVDDEKERVTYSYSFFHFVMMISILYFMMQLTNWGDPGSGNSEHFQNTWAATWVQMSSVWLCFGVYLWTLLAPLILGNCRDFAYE